MSESETCTAAFFLSLGKDVSTEKEFTMTVGLSRNWVPMKDTAGLLKVLIQDGCITAKDGYVRPAIDINSIKVPLTYKPSDDLRARAASAKNAPAPELPKAESPESAPKDLFEEMIDVAVSCGVPQKDFMAYCRKTAKKLSIVPHAAALLFLRENGADISELAIRVEEYICSEM